MPDTSGPLQIVLTIGAQIDQLQAAMERAVGVVTTTGMRLQQAGTQLSAKLQASLMPSDKLQVALVRSAVRLENTGVALGQSLGKGLGTGLQTAMVGVSNVMAGTSSKLRGVFQGIGQAVTGTGTALQGGALSFESWGNRVFRAVEAPQRALTVFATQTMPQFRTLVGQRLAETGVAFQTFGAQVLAGVQRIPAMLSTMVMAPMNAMVANMTWVRRGVGGVVSAGMGGISNVLVSQFQGMQQWMGVTLPRAMGTMDFKLRQLVTTGGPLDTLVYRLRQFERSALVFTAGLSIMAFALGMLIKPAVELEQQMAKVGSTIIDDFATPLNEANAVVAVMTPRVRELTIQFGQSSEVVTNALFDIVSTAIPAAQAMEILEQAGKLAVGGFTDMESASKALVSVLKSYNLEADAAANMNGIFGKTVHAVTREYIENGKAITNVQRISDILFAAQVRGRFDVKQLTDAIGRSATTAALAGVSLEELTAYLATATQAGLTLERSTTGFNRALFNIVLAGPQATKALRAYGVEVGVAAVAQGKMMETLAKLSSIPVDVAKLIFPHISAFLATLPVLQNYAGYLANLGAIYDSLSLTEVKYQAAQKTTAFQLQRMSQAAQDSARSIFAGLLPVVRGLSDVFNAFAYQLSHMPGWLKGMTSSLIAFGGIGVALGPVLVFLFQNMVKVGNITGALGRAFLAFSAISYTSTANLNGFSTALRRWYANAMPIQGQFVASTKVWDDASRKMYNVVGAYDASTKAQIPLAQAVGNSNAVLIAQTQTAKGLEAVQVAGTATTLGWAGAMKALSAAAATTWAVLSRFVVGMLIIGAATAILGGLLSWIHKLRAGAEGTATSIQKMTLKFLESSNTSQSLKESFMEAAAELQKYESRIDSTTGKLQKYEQQTVRVASGNRIQFWPGGMGFREVPASEIAPQDREIERLARARTEAQKTAEALYALGDAGQANERVSEDMMARWAKTIGVRAPEAFAALKQAYETFKDLHVGLAADIFTSTDKGIRAYDKLMRDLKGKVLGGAQAIQSEMEELEIQGADALAAIVGTDVKSVERREDLKKWIALYRGLLESEKALQRISAQRQREDAEAERRHQEALLEAGSNRKLQAEAAIANERELILNIDKEIAKKTVQARIVSVNEEQSLRIATELAKLFAERAQSENNINQLHEDRLRGEYEERELEFEEQRNALELGQDEQDSVDRKSRIRGLLEDQLEYVTSIVNMTANQNAFYELHETSLKRQRAIAHQLGRDIRGSFQDELSSIRAIVEEIKKEDEARALTTQDYKRQLEEWNVLSSRIAGVIIAVQNAISKGIGGGDLQRTLSRLKITLAESELQARMTVRKIYKWVYDTFDQLAKAVSGNFEKALDSMLQGFRSKGGLTIRRFLNDMIGSVRQAIARMGAEYLTTKLTDYTKKLADRLTGASKPPETIPTPATFDLSTLTDTQQGAANTQVLAAKMQLVAARMRIGAKPVERGVPTDWGDPANWEVEGSLTQMSGTDRVTGALREQTEATQDETFATRTQTTNTAALSETTKSTQSNLQSLSFNFGRAVLAVDALVVGLNALGVRLPKFAQNALGMANALLPVIKVLGMLTPLGGIIGGIGALLSLQGGGIVNQPTLAMIGERRNRPEAVIPLSELPRLMRNLPNPQPATQTGPAQITVHFHDELKFERGHMSMLDDQTAWDTWYRRVWVPTKKRHEDTIRGFTRG